MNLPLGLALFLAGLLATEGLLSPNVSLLSYGDLSQARGSKAKRIAHELAKRNMEFGFKLLKKLASRGSRQNIFFSPLSISTAFSMLSLGAQDSTLEEIKQGFSFREMPARDLHQGFYYLIRKLNQEKQGTKLAIGNVLFLDQKLKLQRNFLRETKTMYEAETVPTNFQDLDYTQKQINSYVSQKTQGLINNLIRSIDPGTVMILANFIYFQARWKHRFDPKETREENFFVDKSKTVKVPMMFHGGMYDVGYDDQLSCTLLEIPYSGNITATFVLPEEGKMKQLEEGLQANIFGRWKRLMSKRVVNVFVPKLHISGTYNLKNTLSQLGISKIFEENGDLTRISPYRSLKVSEAVHKAELKMDEKGTEGAAGSGAQTLPMETPQNVKLNRPFMMMIYEKLTPSMIFLAKIVNPSGK
ncbi:serpin A12 [Urocitellus parryii]|uniref:Serpin family A member 12 n=1 Tax=Urocitellus parryii TaxID=9999 RepID=A0A8D2GZQ9_UROPR|nr:serpin A12 [Urocitellus parryii]